MPIVDLTVFVYLPKNRLRVVSNGLSDNRFFMLSMLFEKQIMVAVALRFSHRTDASRCIGRLPSGYSSVDSRIRTIVRIDLDYILDAIVIQWSRSLRRVWLSPRIDKMLFHH